MLQTAKCLANDLDVSLTSFCASQGCLWNWSLSHLSVLLLYNLFAINTSYVIDDTGGDTCTMLLPISGAPSFYIKNHTQLMIPQLALKKE